MPSSIKDVAARAGVSLGTVSNVLNRPESVREVTRLKVEAAIAELGFVRNESARHLGGGRSRMLAYVMLDHSNPFFTDLAEGMEQVAREQGLGLLLMSSNNDPSREDEYIDLLLEQRVRGVMITSNDYARGRLRKLTRQGLPLVLVDRAEATEGMCTVGVDDVEGGALAATHLLEQGHRRLAFVGGPTSIPQIADRLQGARASVALQADADLRVLLTASATVAEGREAASRLMGIPSSRRPTAVLCANDLVALGVLQALIHRGVRIPDEVALVGYDDIDFAAAAAIPLTSVRQPRTELGRTAARLLLEESENGASHEHSHVRFTPELVVRQSSVPMGSVRAG